MNRLMIAGTGSGCGKTTVSCALMAAFKNKGLNVVSFKCGPDYIDPMFHRKATSIPAYNLDILLMGEDNVRYSLITHGNNADICVIEGVMGLYDGVGDSGTSSANHLSSVTNTPVVLVVNVRGKAQSVCAEIFGYMNYSDNNIAAVVLNNASEAIYPFYKNMVEQRLPVKVAGFMPSLPESRIESRHLGLVTADEIGDIKTKLNLLAANAEKYIDTELLLAIASGAPQIQTNENFLDVTPPERRSKIYVAEDEAFNFFYEDNHELLTAFGAELCFFSPLNDEHLPEDAAGLILWGGYPELYGKKLFENISMTESIRRKIKDGMPVYAECGGFIYLQERLTDIDGVEYPMIGILKGHTKMAERLQKFGYVELTANYDNMLCRKNEKINAHSFHYSFSNNEGSAFTAAKKNGSGSYPCIVAENNVFAGYPHLHFFGNREFARQFIKACGEYKGEP